jgi:hypothetical protein
MIRVYEETSSCFSCHQPLYHYVNSSIISKVTCVSFRFRSLTSVLMIKQRQTLCYCSGVVVGLYMLSSRKLLEMFSDQGSSPA